MAGRRNLILLGGGAAAAGFFLWPKATPNGNPFETHAVKNVGDAFTSAGGAGSHQSAVATRRGGDLSTESPQEGGSKGVGTAHFDEKHADQKVGEAGAISKAFRQAHSGNDKGK